MDHCVKDPEHIREDITVNENCVMTVVAQGQKRSERETNRSVSLTNGTNDDDGGGGGRGRLVR